MSRSLSAFAASAIFTAVLLTVEGACLCRAILERLRGRRCASGSPLPRRLKVLAIGTFYNANWYRAHLSPLAGASAVAEVRVVTGEPGDAIRGVRWCVAPSLVRRLLGRNFTRALMSTYAAWVWRPDVVIGYFIFPSALLALFLARVVGAKGVYQMCGGPLEIQRCGSVSENPVLIHVCPFPWLERLLFRLVNRFDLIVVRGRVAQRFCEERFSHPLLAALTAGIDGGRFHVKAEIQKTCDLIAVSRVSKWKRLDVMIEAVARLAAEVPGITATIVGEGPEMEELRSLSERLGMESRVQFTGQRDDIEWLLAQSRVFVLPSSSEGLSIAMVEAMACGLPVVVSDVGELREVVQHGQNGYLVAAGDGHGFAVAIRTLLRDRGQLEAFGARAAADAVRLCGEPIVSEGWSRVLELVASRSPTADRGVEGRSLGLNGVPWHVIDDVAT